MPLKSNTGNSKSDFLASENNIQKILTQEIPKIYTEKSRLITLNNPDLKGLPKSIYFKRLKELLVEQERNNLVKLLPEKTKNLSLFFFDFLLK